MKHNKINETIPILNAANRNGRIYSPMAVRHAFKEFEEKIEERTALGELDHPNPDYSVVTLKNVSHRILDIL